MGELIDAGIDLALLAACLVALGMVYLTDAFVTALLKILDVGIGPWHPFHGIVNKAKNAVAGAFHTAELALEKQATKFLNGLYQAGELIIGIPLLLAVALQDLLLYLWHTAIRGLVNGIVGPVRTTANAAVARISALEGTVSDNLTKAEHYAETAANGAISDSEAFTRRWIDNAVSVLNAAIASAIATAEGYTDKAIGRLQALEDAAVDHAVALAVDAKNAGIAAAASALTTAEGYTDSAKAAAIAAAAGALTTAESYTDAAKNVALEAAGGALTTAEHYADVAANAAEAGAEAAAAQATAAVSSALGEVRSIAIDVQHDLGTIEGTFGAAGLGALVAGIPALATFLNAIATETGLENKDCRQKVKGICATPSNVWEDLLAGLVATGFAFSLVELAEVAEPLAMELVPVIEQAA